MTGNSRFRMILLLFCSSFILVITSPVYLPQFLPGGSGRNIRHLPCVSRRSGETGVCMFAFTCAKAKGTHLGTCIDRFYFGSCCKLDGEADIFPQDNTIDDVPLKPFVTTHGPIESNNIPEYSPKPTTTTTTRKPVETTVLPANVTKEQVVTSEKPLKLANATTTQHVGSKPSNSSTSTTTAPTKLTTNKPNVTSTTQLPSVSPVTEPVLLSTVQFVRNNSLATSSTTVNRPTPTITRSTPRPTTTTTISTSKRPQRPTSSTPTTHTTKLPPISPKPTSPKPVQKPTFQNITKTSSKPTPRPTTLSSPSSAQPVKQTSTTVKPSSTATRKPVVVTRFPPRNTTTTTHRPTRRPTTVKPPTTTLRTTSSQTQKITTSRPSSATVQKIKPTLKPTSPSSAATISTSSSKKPAIAITDSTTLTSVKIPTTLSAIATVSTSSPKPVTVGERPSISDNKPATEIPTSVKPIIKRPTTTTTTTTTAKPIVTPSTKPTPVVPNIVSKPGQSTTTTTETYVVTLGPKPTTVHHHTPTSSTTEKPFKRPTVTTTTTQKPIVPSSNVTPSLSVTSPSTTSVFNNEVLPVESTNGLHQNVNQFESTTHMPGLVTWTSNSDNVLSKFPVIETTTAASEEPTFTEWTPITTPDGWVLIQSPTPDLTTEHNTKPTISSSPTTTQKPSVSKKPSTTSSSTTNRPTAKPTLPTVDARPSTTEDSISTAALNMSDYKQVCGRRLYPESRIVGGTRSSFGKWPWQISLRQWRTSTYLHKCGAALLNENWAITAAHCVENVPPSDLLLRLGEYDLANEDEPYGFQERRVQIVASHPQFDPRTYEYDLALLRFYEPLLPFQPNTLPICLPDDDATYVGQTAYVTGWGRLYEEGPLPSVLQEVPVPIMNNTVCEAMYRSAGYIEHIPKIFICAGWRKGGFDSCEGDSGGPLVIQRQRDKRWILAGTISWGIGCAEPNQPGVYTRISEFREWINQILQF